MEAQNPFDGNAVEPTRRTGVPRPSTATRVRRSAVDVRTHHVRFDPVLLHRPGGGGMRDRVDQVPQLHRTVAQTLQRRCENDPRGGMRVLATVLPDARHVPFDVAGLKHTFVERRVEQLDQLVTDTYQSLLNRVHCGLRPCRIGYAGNDRPRLWDGVNLALIVLG